MTKIRTKNNINSPWISQKWYSVASWHRHVDEAMVSRSWKVSDNNKHPESFDASYPQTHNYTVFRGEHDQEQTDNPPTHDEFRHEFLTDDGGEYEIIREKEQTP